ncbi:MAG: TolC family protein [Porticoccus sp.]|nr:TolC family protein [Porticoccus sp.]
MLVRHGHYKRLFVASALLLSAACAPLHSNEQAAAAKALTNSYTSWSYEQVDGQAVNQLNDLISIDELQQLVDLALVNNPGLQQTTIALQIAYANQRVTAADRLPMASTSFSKNSTEDSDDNFNANLAISWELDLWQKLSDKVSASKMDIASTEAAYQAARDALAANVMRSWLEIILQRQLIVIENNRLQLLENNARMIMQRYRNGLGELEDLDNASASVASTRATLASYQQSLNQLQRSLRQLLGYQKNPAELPDNSTFPKVLQPLAVLPEQDLARRPDLQQAYYAIKAAQYRADVAYKDLLPSISLSAALNDVGSSASDALFTSPVWSLLGQITAPLFQGGKLKAQKEIAELTVEQQYWVYQETLLTAVTEVNNALGNEQSLEQQQLHINNALSNARRSATNYEAKYRQGLVDILDLLSVQQQVFDLQSQSIQITYSRLANRIDLGLALGLEASS